MTKRPAKQYSEAVKEYARRYGYSREYAAKLLAEYQSWQKSQEVLDSLPPTAEGW